MSMLRNVLFIPMIFAAATAGAADPRPAPEPKAPASTQKPAPSVPTPAAVPPPAPTVPGELTGWGEPLPGDLAVLEEIEGENLAEARKQGPVKIQSTRKDLNGDGMPELFFHVNHPMFCWEEEGCAILVMSRASLKDPYREVGVVVAPSTSVIVLKEGGSEFPSLKAIGARTYLWDGQVYKVTGPSPTPLVLDEDEPE